MHPTSPVSEPGTSSAICASHPDRPAQTSCARCGQFACEECLGTNPLCPACKVRAVSALRSTRGNAARLPWWMGIQVLLSALGAVVEMAFPTDDDFDLLVNMALALPTLGVMVVSATEFCIWMSRFTRNATQLGARFTRSSGWAIGSFFVPFATLVVPHRHMTEVAEWTLFRDPKKAGVTAWWSAWIASNLVSWFSTRAAAADVTSLRELGGMSALVAAVISGVAAVLAVRMIRALEHGMNERLDEIRGQTQELGPMVRRALS